MTAYYNEIDLYAADWLKNLMAAGLIAPGIVDTRSIAEVQPDDLKGYTQCHFFAGIGGWSLALRMAGWADARPVWTGSCPCQPFSAAGKQQGTKDDRHLWPEFARLIGECSPSVVFGEQVASKAGRDWLAVVRSDLEGMGYGVGAADLCAAGVGAPHIRQRLWFVARTGCQGRVEVCSDVGRGGEGSRAPQLDERPLHGGSWGLAHAERGQQDARLERRHGDEADQDGQATVGRGDRASGVLAYADGWHASAEGVQRSGQYRQQPQDSLASQQLGHPDDARLEGRRLPDSGRAGERVARAADGDAGGVLGDADQQPGERGTRGIPAAQAREHGEGQRQHGGSAVGPSDASEGLGALGDADEQQRNGGGGFRAGGRHEPSDLSPWRGCDWLPCRDGKARPTQSGLFPLAHGIPARVGRLRAYGNAIVPQVAATFIRAYLEAVADGDEQRGESAKDRLMEALTEAREARNAV